MKYIVALLALILCCSFTICDKLKIKYHGISSTLYIYPDCDDSTTFIQQEYYVSEATKERKVPSKIWTIEKESVSINECFCIHNQTVYDSYIHLGQDTFYSENTHNNCWVKTSSVEPPFSREVRLNDSSKMRIQYFRNGRIWSCEFGVLDRTGHIYECIEWDTSYESKWKGFLKDVRGSTDSIEYEYPDGESGYKIVVSHPSVKTGTWKKYNSADVLIDSMVYK